MAPGIYAYPERWLTDAEVLDIADIVCAKPDVWNPLREVKAEQMIDADLLHSIINEQRLFVEQRGWQMSGEDMLRVMRVLRTRAAAYQADRSF